MHAYREGELKQNAAEDYRTDLLVWAQLAPHTKEQKKPPRLPSVLLEK